MIALALFISTFAVVYALGAQSLFVNNGFYSRAFFNSLLISVCNLALLKLGPDATTLQMVCYIMGGPLGIVAAMYTFRHLHRKPDESAPTGHWLKQLLCRRHHCYTSGIKRREDGKVESACIKCGKVLVAEYGLALDCEFFTRPS